MKTSDIVRQAKQWFIPHIKQTIPQANTNSISYSDPSNIQIPSSPCRKLRVAVVKGDPVDVALDWYDTNRRDPQANAVMRSGTARNGIPVVSMANEKRPGGDWESGAIRPEENLCRRSTLSLALKTPTLDAHYPMMGGIYSPHVGMFVELKGLYQAHILTSKAVTFRYGADQKHKIWKDYKALPVISVSPVRNPRLDETGTEYAFDLEKEIMREKMRLVLRIAAHHQHEELCLGPFGVGPGFFNPVSLVATMWKEILFFDKEFQGAFSSVVFAIESGATSYLRKEAKSVLNVFEREFDASNVVKTNYRYPNNMRTEEEMGWKDEGN